MAVLSFARPLNNILRRQIRGATGNTHASVTQAKFNRIASGSHADALELAADTVLSESKLSSVGGGEA
jgi:hypothetical protein